MEQILITQTDMRSDSTMQINFSIMSTLLTGTVSVSQDAYLSAIQKGGFDSIKNLVLDTVEKQLSSLKGKKLNE